MAHSRRKRVAHGALLLLATPLTLTACASQDDATTPSDSASSGEGCSAYEAYLGNEGTEVTIFSHIRDTEADLYMESWAEFEECTGIAISYEGSSDFETQLQVRAQSGDLPDISFLPQPGTLVQLAEDGLLTPASPGTQANLETYYAPSWSGYGTVDGVLYAAPLSSNVKSLVWYSPSAFADAGYEVPTTWEELIELSDQMVADGSVPWCAGFESGDATGWPGTDWLEDVVLRVPGPDVYDQWIAHEIPFDDAQIADALDAVGDILKNSDYVNGGFGDAASIAMTSFNEGGLPILDGTCQMHRQGGFYSAQWPDGTTVGVDGDVYAFYLPAPAASDETPVLGGGEFTVAFDDRPEVQAVQTYLSSPEWSNLRAALGGWTSANTGIDPNVLPTEIDKLSEELLQDPDVVFRFDASDQMPAAVGSGSFWTGMVNWITGASTEETLAYIESTWP